MIVDKYGPFTSLVATAGVIISAAGALIMGFRRGAKWEPIEIDIDRGPRRVASLLTAIGLVVEWSEFQVVAKIPLLIELAVELGIASVICLVVYGFVSTVFSYYKVIVDDDGKHRTVKTIGGLWLTRGAKETIATRKITIQDFFEGTAYNHDYVWSRVSTGLARTIFVICYICLTVSGSVALTTLAVIVGLKSQSS
jgi:hypothetical protein